MSRNDIKTEFIFYRIQASQYYSLLWCKISMLDKLNKLRVFFKETKKNFVPKFIKFIS